MDDPNIAPEDRERKVSETDKAAVRMTPTTPPPTSSPSGNSLECAGGVGVAANMSNGIRALQTDNQELRDHCYVLASHLRWASKVIATFGKSAQLDAIEDAISRWERQQ